MRDKHINPMRSLSLDTLGGLEAIAEGLGVSVSTVYNWRKGKTAPKAIQVYGICSLLRLRPTTFTPYTGHPVIYRMPSSVSETPTAEAMGEWVRRRIDQCRKGEWVSRAVLARQCRLNPRTVRKCIESDDIGWDYLLWFIEIGLRVLPHDLMDVQSAVPIPHTDEGLEDYTREWSRYVPGRTQKKPGSEAKAS